MIDGRETINYDFQNAKVQSDKLDELAIKLNKIAESSLEGLMKNIYCNWRGDNASAYLQKMEQVQENVKHTAERFQEIAEIIREDSKNLREVEDRNKELTL